MKEEKPIELIHIVDDLDAKAIARGYYKDLANSNIQQFIGISNAKKLFTHYYLTPTINQTYVYDTPSQRYFLLDDSLEKRAAQSRLEALIVAFGYMGAMYVKGEVTELSKKERQLNTNGGVTAKTVEINLDVKKQLIQELSKTISVERRYRDKSIKNYRDVEKYLVVNNLKNVDELEYRLKELRDKGAVTGTYKVSTTLTHHLDSILSVGFKASITPFFKGNASLQKRFSSHTEIQYSLFVSFDEEA